MPRLSQVIFAQFLFKNLSLGIHNKLFLYPITNKTYKKSFKIPQLKDEPTKSAIDVCVSVCSCLRVCFVRIYNPS